MSDQSKDVQARQQQSDQAKRATKELLFGKASRPRTYTAEIAGERVTFQFQAVGQRRYDRMVTDCPPTVEQRADGANVNPAKFAPKLLAAVCIDPALSEQEWAELWTSDNWSSGELADLYATAYRLCQQGLDLSPTEAG